MSQIRVSIDVTLKYILSFTITIEGEPIRGLGDLGCNYKAAATDYLISRGGRFSVDIVSSGVRWQFTDMLMLSAAALSRFKSTCGFVDPVSIFLNF